MTTQKSQYPYDISLVITAVQDPHVSSIAVQKHQTAILPRTEDAVNLPSSNTQVLASHVREGFPLIRSDMSFERWPRTVGGLLLPQVSVGTFRVRKTFVFEKLATYLGSQESPGHHMGCPFPAGPIHTGRTLQSVFITISKGCYSHCDRLSSSCHRLLNFPDKRRARQR